MIVYILVMFGLWLLGVPVVYLALGTVVVYTILAIAAVPKWIIELWRYKKYERQIRGL